MHRKWQPPIPFDDIQAPDISADLLEGDIRDYVKALAVNAEVPEALPLMTVLGVISACIANRFVVSPKLGWNEPVNIYSLVALPPANNKSLIMRQCLAPLVEWECKQRDIAKDKQKRILSERKSKEKMIEAKRNQIIKLKERHEQQSLIEEIANLEAALPEVKPLPQLFANDATPESLGQSFAEQDGRFAIFSDEAGIIETLSGLYSGGSANVDILLKGIDGGHVRVRRRDRDYDLNPYLTLMLAVQPQILLNMASKRAFAGNGALERFLYVIPKSKLGYRTHDTDPVPYDIEQSYYDLITNLLNKHALSEEPPVKLSLSHGALLLWREFQAKVEKELRPSGKLHLCIGWGGKISGFTLRIVALMHITSKTPSTEISSKIMLRAVTLANLLIDHALIAYGMMGANHSLSDAKELWSWLRSRGEDKYTRSDISYGLRSRKIGKATRLNAALEALCNKHYLLAETINTQKPTTVYYINPLATKEHE